MSEVSATHLAGVLGITPRHVNRLASEGVLERTADGFDLEAAVRRYCEHLRSDAEVRAERRKLLEAQTNATRLRAQRQTGELLTLREVRRRLEPFEGELLEMRTVAGWLHQELAGVVDENTRMALAGKVHNWLCSLIRKSRDNLAATFADPKAEALEAGLERLGVQASGKAKPKRARKAK